MQKAPLESYVQILAALFILVVAFSSSVAGQASNDDDGQPDFPVPMQEITVLVVDEDDKPVEGVQVSAMGLRCEEDPGSWYGWPIQNAGRTNKGKTDGDGKVSIAYPTKFGVPPNFQTTNKLDITFTHYNYVLGRQEYDPRGTDELKHTLLSGCEVSFTAQNEAGEPLSDFWISMAGSGGRAEWNLEKGEIRSRGVPDGSWQTMLVAPQPDGKTLFSGVLPTRFRKDSEFAIRGVKLTPGLELQGQLDAKVPRPIQDGKVIVWQLPKPKGRVHATENASLGWSASTSINEDGTFAFPSLPRTGQLQFIALCRRWIITSEPRDGNGANGFFILGTQQSIAAEAIEDGRMSGIVLPMEEAGALEVTLTKPDGAPLIGAEVSTWPNQKMDKSGSQLLGACYSSLEMMEVRIAGKDLEDYYENKTRESRFVQVTDTAGKAILHDIPVKRDYQIALLHNEYRFQSNAPKKTPIDSLDYRLEKPATKKMAITVVPIADDKESDL
ncbi:MAG: hypothetical protein AAF483_00680 [Planctomycetota bacterium]